MSSSQALTPYRGLGPRTALASCLVRLQRRLEMNLEALQRHVTPQSVHDVRTAARRLRAILQIFKRQLSPPLAQDYRRSLKRVTRGLGRVRDADVAHQYVANLVSVAHRRRRRRGKLALLSADLNRRRLRLALKLRAQIAEPSWAERVSMLRSAASARDLVLLNKEPIGTAASALVTKRRRRLRARLLKSKRIPRALHRLRLRVKALRYLCEEAGSLGAAGVDPGEVVAIVRLQDCLGQLHDLEALRHEATNDHAPRELRVRVVARRKDLLRAYDEQRWILLHLWDNALGNRRHKP
jgi:CHAD domain-containing protein